MLRTQKEKKEFPTQLSYAGFTCYTERKRQKDKYVRKLGIPAVIAEEGEGVGLWSPIRMKAQKRC
jgi:hypothetical protein